MNETSTIHGRTNVLVVSGMSGAGKSTALKILEDLGYEAVDNLPLSLLPRLTAGADGSGAPLGRAIAVGIDSRTRDFAPEAFIALLEQLRQRHDLTVSLLYLDCDDDMLQSRFTATRRRHPLAGDRPVGDGIALERRMIGGLRDRADLMLDSSHLSLPELRQLLSAQFALETTPGLNVTIVSFSYRRGLPRVADMIFDVRFLANPHYVDKLRPLTGEDPATAAFIAADPTFAPFFRGIGKLMLSLLPSYAREGKRYLTIGIGCTGGRHRSVFVAGKLAQLLLDEGYPATLRHRDKDIVMD